MKIKFDQQGNLANDVNLTCLEFIQLFGSNDERKKNIENLFTVAAKLKRIGCNTVFVFGSFATQKEFPGDIDACFDISNIDVKIIEKNVSLFDKYERRRYHAYLKVHLPFFKINDADDELMQFLKKDKDGNPRGIIKVNLQDLPLYDKE